MPAGAFSFRSIVGNGLWMAFALMLASYAFAVYGPVLLQTLHGVPATMAGGFVALQSFSWTVAALAVAALGNAPERGIIVAGPITMLVGLFGLAFALSGGPFWVIPIFVFCQGAGIGMCWAFVCKRIMSFALDGDGDIAAAAIPTTQMFGMSFGAALAGVVANAFGFSTGLTAASAASVAQWLHASFALAALVALIAAVQLVRLEVRRRPQGPLS